MAATDLRWYAVVVGSHKVGVLQAAVQVVDSSMPIFMPTRACPKSKNIMSW